MLGEPVIQSVGRVAASVLLLGLFATACTIEASDLGETEERYLERIGDELSPLRDTTKAFDEVYQETRSRTRFADQLKVIPVQTRIVRVFREVQRIRPPTRFFNDQRRILQALVAMSPVARSAHELANDDQVIKASTRFAHTVVLYQRALTDTTSRFCLVAATSASERDVCDPIGILPGGVYGDRLHSALAKGSAEFSPRGFLFVAQSWTNLDVANYLQSIGKSLVDGVVQTRDQIRKLVPPDDFAADHRVLEKYFSDLVRVSDDIAEAAENNRARLRTLFPESQRIVRNAADELSEDIRPAVAVWFFPSEDDTNG